MKTQFVNTLRTGDPVDAVFVLAQKSLASKKDGSPYLNIVVSDKTGSLKGVVWDNAQAMAEAAASGELVRIEGAVNEYRGALQLVVRRMEPVSAAEASPADFLPSTSRNIDAMFESLLKIARRLETPCLKALLEAFWQDPVFIKGFKSAPAAKKMHHAYVGGLLEHTLSMALLADKVAGHYEGVDRELLIVGALLHDIGKIREFDYDLNIDYSDEGRLLNHIVLGVEMLEEKLRQIPDFPPTRALLLKHLIVSHHGTREFGSPEPPKTIEAVLLNFIDDMDAKVNGIRTYITADDDGASWTPYHRVLERHFYRGGPE